MTTEERRRELFRPLERAILLCEFSDADVFGMLADSIEENPAIALAFCRHLSVLHARIGEEEEWTHSALVAKAYYDVFFDPSFSAQYHTDYLGDDEEQMQIFVESHVRMLSEGLREGAGSVFIEGDTSITH